jgi:hypothetical protein
MARFRHASKTSNRASRRVQPGNWSGIHELCLSKQTLTKSVFVEAGTSSQSHSTSLMHRMGSQPITEPIRSLSRHRSSERQCDVIASREHTYRAGRSSDRAFKKYVCMSKLFLRSYLSWAANEAELCSSAWLRTVSLEILHRLILQSRHTLN